MARHRPRTSDDVIPADAEPVATEDSSESDSPDVTVHRAKAAEDRAVDDAPKPKFGTPVPAGPGTLPRVVSELVRAGEGQTRYKIACRNYSPQKTRYVLAADGDEAGAIDCYLKANGLDKAIARLKGRGASPEPPELVVTELAD